MRRIAQRPPSTEGSRAPENRSDAGFYFSTTWGWGGKNSGVDLNGQHLQDGPKTLLRQGKTYDAPWLLGPGEGLCPYQTSPYTNPCAPWPQ